MSTRILGRIVLALCALAISAMAAVPLAAQTVQENGESAVELKLKRDLATLAIRFWTVRLNDYKTRIDRTLSPSDLAELNQARVFTSLFIQGERWKELADAAGSIFDRPESSDEPDSVFVHIDTARVAMDSDAARIMMDSAHMAIDSAQTLMDPAQMAIDSAQQEYNESEEYQSEEYQFEEEMPEMTVAERTEQAEKAGEFVDNVSEIFENLFLAKRMARRYRVQLGDLRQMVINDAMAFIDTIYSFKLRFEQDNRAAIGRNPELMEAFGKFNRDEIRAKLTEAATSTEMSMAFNFAIEPFIMLYNGEDYLRIIRDNDMLPSELADIAISTDSELGGATIQASGGNAVVIYRLSEPSPRTTLRLYNATGQLVGTYDQGPRSAGEHTITIDLGSLSSGTYLYSLSIGTSTGDRVMSRALQVAK